MFVFFIVQGQSMEPYCEEGDFVLSVPYIFSHPKVGDIAVLRHPQEGIVMVKRITNVKGDWYWVEGDNKLESSDSREFGWISREHILGKAYIVGKPRTRASSVRGCASLELSTGCRLQRDGIIGKEQKGSHAVV